MLLVTYGCNLRCSYCYEPKTSNRQISVEKAKEFILQSVDKLDSSYTEFEVQFMGGEPLLVFSLIRQVSEWLWNESFKIPLVQIFAPTNGTLLSQDIKDWATANKDRFCLGLSFDGNRLMQNINRSESASKVDLMYFATTWPKQSVKMTLSPQTLHYLYDGVLYLYKNGLYHITADLAMGKDIAWEQQHLNILAEQLELLSDYYIKNPNCPRLSMLDFDVVDVLRATGKPLKKCGCGEELECIDIDGIHYACHLFSPIAASLDVAKSSLKIDFSKHQDFIDDDCRKCLLQHLCTFCYGMNYICSGDLAHQSSFTCSSFKIQFLTACAMQLNMAHAMHDTKREKLIQSIVSQFHN